MNKFFTIAVLLMLCGMALAQDDSTGVFPASEVWPIFKTSVAPTVDGVMDSIWFNSGAQIVDNGPGETTVPDDWFDLFCEARMMWDDTNLYLFFTLQDDILNDGVGLGNDWNYDGVEVF